MSFDASHPALARALAARAYLEPTSVQDAVLAQADTGRDLLVSAQTGSGKTVAYGLALAPSLLGAAERFERAGKPLALVVAPTRELALQVHRELSWLYEQTGARVISCVGGMDARFEQRQLNAGAHIVVGTPGRLRDHVERGNLDLSQLLVATLDEADEMLDLGFREDLEFLLEAAPKERRTLLFSATIAPDIAALARRYQRDALRIDTLQRHVPHADIEYRAVRCQLHEVENALVNVLRYYDPKATIVFCGTREGVRRLHANLENRGFAAVALSGELSQSDRTYALQALRDGRARVCVATDVAARGLDLPELSLVVHADLPSDKEILLHRSGRTGRAGRKGVSLLMVPHPRRRKAEMLLQGAGVRCEWSPPPSAEEIRAKDQERLLADPILTAENSEADLVLAQRLLEGRSAEDIAAALIRLYHSRLPMPCAQFEFLAPMQPARAAAPRPHERGPKPEYAHNNADIKPRATGETTWFRINIGRVKNADPKWLLPLICRVGEVTRNEIGTIRIFDRETKFEIAAEAAASFAEAVAASSGEEFQIVAAAAPSMRMPPREGAKPDRHPAAKPAYNADAGRKRPMNDDGRKRPAGKHRAG